MTETEPLCPEALEQFDEVADEYCLFIEIEEIADDLADLNPEQLHAIRMLYTHFKVVIKI